MKVQLCISGKDLPSDSDVVAVVTLGDEEVGRTEVVAESSSPDWEKVFVFDTEENDAETIVVNVSTESDGSEIGTADFDVSALLEKKVDGKAIEGGGFIFAHAKEKEPNGSLKLQICAKGLRNTEGFLGLSRDKSDPFFKIHSSSGDEVYEADVIMNTLDPVWPEAEVELDALCDGDLEAPLKFVIFDHDPDGGHDYMGEFTLSVQGILSTMEAADEIDVQKHDKVRGNALVLGAELIDYINPRDVASTRIEAAAAAIKAKEVSEANSEAAAAAMEKAEKARVVAEEKEAQAQDLSQQLEEAEKEEEDAKAAAQEAADEAASATVTGTLLFQLEGEKFKNTEGLFRKPDPFFALQKGCDGEDDEKWSNVHISDVIMDTLSPSWPECEVELSALGDGDLDGPLRFVVFDKEKDGKHELMGFFETSVNGILSAKEEGLVLSMTKKGDETGKINVVQAELKGYVDPSVYEEKVNELKGKADQARYFVMGKKSGAQIALDEAEEAKTASEELAKEAEAASEAAEAAKQAEEEAASALADLVA